MKPEDMQSWIDLSAYGLRAIIAAADRGREDERYAVVISEDGSKRNTTIAKQVLERLGFQRNRVGVLVRFISKASPAFHVVTDIRQALSEARIVEMPIYRIHPSSVPTNVPMPSARGGAVGNATLHSTDALRSSSLFPGAATVGSNVRRRLGFSVEPTSQVSRNERLDISPAGQGPLVPGAGLPRGADAGGAGAGSGTGISGAERTAGPGDPVGGVVRGPDRGAAAADEEGLAGESGAALPRSTPGSSNADRDPGGRAGAGRAAGRAGAEPADLALNGDFDLPDGDSLYEIAAAPADPVAPAPAAVSEQATPGPIAPEDSLPSPTADGDGEAVASALGDASQDRDPSPAVPGDEQVIDPRAEELPVLAPAPAAPPRSAAMADLVSTLERALSREPAPAAAETQPVPDAPEAVPPVAEADAVAPEVAESAAEPEAVESEPTAAAGDESPAAPGADEDAETVAGDAAPVVVAVETPVAPTAEDAPADAEPATDIVAPAAELSPLQRIAAEMEAQARLDGPVAPANEPEAAVVVDLPPVAAAPAAATAEHPAAPAAEPNTPAPVPAPVERPRTNLSDSLEAILGRYQAGAAAPAPVPVAMAPAPAPAERRPARPAMPVAAAPFVPPAPAPAPQAEPAAVLVEPRPVSPDAGTNFVLGDEHLENFYIPAVTAAQRFSQNLAASVVAMAGHFTGRPVTDEERLQLATLPDADADREILRLRFGSVREQITRSRLPGQVQVQVSELLNGINQTGAQGLNNISDTPPAIVDFAWSALRKMGFRPGSVLDIGAGRGMFQARRPEEYAECRFTAVEPNHFQCALNRVLFPRDHQVQSAIENAELPAGFYAMAVTSIGTSSHSLIRDPTYQPIRPSGVTPEEYGILKAASSVAVGGVVVARAPSVFMDSMNSSVREHLQESFDLIAAFRLPNGEAPLTRSSQAPTDLIILRRREPAADAFSNSWVETDFLAAQTEGEVPYTRAVNRYFLEHPECVIGQLRLREGGSPTVTLREGARQGAVMTHEEWQRLLAPALDLVPDNVLAPPVYDRAIQQFTPESASQAFRTLPIGAYCFAADGSLAVRTLDGTSALPQNVSASARRLISAAIPVRDAYYDLVGAQLENAPDEVRAERRRVLNERYDRFELQFGHFYTPEAERALRFDPTRTVLAALAEYNSATDTTTKSEIFVRDTIQPTPVVEPTNDPVEALTQSLGRFGRVDLPWMCDLTGMSRPSMEEALNGRLFLDPDSGNHVIAEMYLSGNIRRKLDRARAAAAVDPRFAVNVSSLESRVPVELPADVITARLGSSWIPTAVVRQFCIDVLRISISGRNNSIDDFKVNHIPETATWAFEYPERSLRQEPGAEQAFATSRLSSINLVETALNQRAIEVRDPVGVGSNRTYVMNTEETVLAQNRMADIQREFSTWLWADADRRAALTERYNRVMNSWVEPVRDHSWLTTPDISAARPFREVQKAAIARGLLYGNMLGAIAVGGGKTGVAAGIGKESVRMRLSNKPAFVVQRSLLFQACGEILRFYPTARVLAISSDQLSSPERQQQFAAQCANNNWDMVVMTHDAFERLEISAEFESRMLRAELTQHQGILANLEGDNEGDREANRRAVANIRAAIKRIETRIDRATAREQQVTSRQSITFEQTGIDLVIIDEAQRYKRLDLATKMNVAGIETTGSERAWSTYCKCQYVRQINGGNRGVVMLTGTPITNTMTEMWTMSRYVSSKAYDEAGIHHFDAWAANFGQTVEQLEQSVDGTSFKMTTRFAKFHNLQEAIAGFRSFAMVVDKAALGLPTPPVVRHNIVAPLSDMQRDYKKVLSLRLMSIREHRVGVTTDNVLKILGDFNRSMLDMQSLTNDAAPHDQGRVAQCAAKVFEVWSATTAQRSAQMVFCDSSTPKSDGSWSAYSELKRRLVRMGIPEAQIAFVHDAATDAARESLFDAVRQGVVRVIAGSTEKMGTGTNAQERLRAIHHLDAPPRPTDLEQREGRADRFGNTSEQVDIYTYTTEGHTREYELLQTKARFIGQALMDPEKASREISEEVDAKWAETMALTTDNPVFRQKFEIDQRVNQLTLTVNSERGARVRAGRELVRLSDIYSNLVPKIETWTAFATQVINRKAFETEVRKKEAMRQKIKAIIEHEVAAIRESAIDTHNAAMKAYEKLLQQRPAALTRKADEMRRYEAAAQRAQGRGMAPPTAPSPLPELPPAPEMPPDSALPKPSLAKIVAEAKAAKPRIYARAEASDSYEMIVAGRVCSGREESARAVEQFIQAQARGRSFAPVDMGVYLGKTVRYRRDMFYGTSGSLLASESAGTFSIADTDIEVEAGNNPGIMVDKIRAMFGRAVNRAEQLSAERNELRAEIDAIQNRISSPIPEEGPLAVAQAHKAEIDRTVAEIQPEDVASPDSLRSLAYLAAHELRRGRSADPLAISPVFDPVALTHEGQRIVLQALRDQGLELAGGRREARQAAGMV